MKELDLAPRVRALSPRVMLHDPSAGSVDVFHRESPPMSLSTLPLSYCTNVHPGRSVEEVDGGLDRYTVPIQARFGHPLAAGLWLASPVTTELLANPATLNRFAEGLQHRNLTCHTLNAFPFGDFHSARVKENVYLPDWTNPARLNYTMQCAQILARLLPPGSEGSISTVPLGFKGFTHPPDFLDRAAAALVECAVQLSRLYEQTGKLIRLAIEPEPFCELETTAEALAFFELLWQKGECVIDLVRRHIGLCYDVCHQAVEFEDVAESIRQIDQAGVRINKVHLSCALQLDHPMENPEGRAALRRYVEPRYLHQTMARTPAGQIARLIDLTHEAVDAPAEAFRSAPLWRIHFHVPVDAEHLGPLSTTRPALRAAIPAVAALSYAPHLEVETYTWEVLPGTGPADLVSGLARELTATSQLFSATAPTAIT